MKVNIILVVFFIAVTFCIRQDDKVAGPPGMNDTVAYSGYLQTGQGNRKLHYVFVQADQSSDTAPLAIWLNGGPGCSSLIGFMQQIGPYLVGDTYKFGDPLTKNQYRWNKAANVLYIQSPGIVGFSTDTDPKVKYSDRQTADDCFVAIKDFMQNVAPEFKNRELYIAGESYAGKYIPDLAVRILDNNRLANITYINLKGIMIGNGIMNHADNSLSKSRIQYMIDHDFISQRLLSVYRGACAIDFFSPRCEYFKYEFQLLRNNLNYYNVYEVCQNTGRSIEQIRTQEFTLRIQQRLNQLKKAQIYGENLQKLVQDYTSLKQINNCPIDNGMIDYLNMYKAAYHVEKGNKTWAPCSDIDYDITVPGSMDQYKEIFLNKAVKVWLFSGDWDDVVPFPDTVYNLDLLKKKKTGNLEPWFVGQTHAGFYQVYDSLQLITVKGAGHWVPIFKPKASYQMFYNFIKNRPINTPV